MSSIQNKGMCLIFRGRGKREKTMSKFDLIVKRKQITYEQLRKELEELKERVKESEAEVEKWKKVKSEKVNERLEELIGRTEKFNWH